MKIDKKEKRIEELRTMLTDIYVEHHDEFKKCVDEINNVFKILDMDFKYNYDGFCSDYTEECLKFFKKNPDLDFFDLGLIPFYNSIIVSELIVKIKKQSNICEKE